MHSVLKNKNFWSYVILVAAIFLFACSFIFQSLSYNRSSFAQQVKSLEKQIHKQQQDVKMVLEDTALISRFNSGRATQADLDFLYKKPYFFYLYGTAGTTRYLKFWNTAVTIIPDSIINNGKSEEFLRLSNGYYFIKKSGYKNKDGLKVCYAILIKSQFFITSDNFKESYPLNTGLDDIAEISDTPTSDVVRSLSGKVLFYLKQKPGTISETDDYGFVILRLISFFFIFLAIYFILFKSVVRKYKFADIPFFIACLLLFRILLYLFSDLFQLQQLELFNPALYEAGRMLPSLGDLLISSALFCWFGIFIWNRIKPDGSEPPKPQKGHVQWIKGILYIFFLLLLTFTTVNVIRSIVARSQVSFDVTNFFSLSFFTAVGFVILAFLSLGFHYFSRIIYNYLFPSFAGRVYYIYLLIAVLGLSYIAISSTHSIKLYLFCLSWLLLYTFLFNNETALNRLIRFNISGIVIWIFIFSISISVLMLAEINKAELAQRKLYLEKLETKSNPSTERLVVMANTYLDNDFFQDNFHRLYDKTQNQFLRDSILSTNYYRYLREYAGSIYFFDSTHQPLFNPGALTYESINTIISRQSDSTGLPDLYIYEASYGNFAYITYRTIKDDAGQLVGNVCIISQPKKFSSVDISPELFRQYHDWEFYNSPVYSYAIYSDKLLVSSSKKYPFTYSLVQSQIPKTTFELRNNNGYSELWYRPSANKVIVMTRKNERVLETITLFSYIFCAFLFLVALIQLMSNLLNLILNKSLLKKRLQFSTSIRGQIHNTFILITLLSFLVIGIATISFFIQRFEDSNAEHLGRTMNIMVNEMQSRKEIGSLVYEQADTLNSQRLEDIIKRVADIHGVDVNIYNFKGALLASSQPDLYRKGVLSTQIDPRAYYYLLRLRRIEHTQKEKVSELKYTNMYAPLRNDAGFFYAYLSIPYFTSEKVLNEEISRFLVTLINLNAFIFLITGLVALLITNRVTHSFALIRDKLMQVNLSKNNEMIVWEKNDEIGSLVAEYNKMVTKLQISANALAKSERQEAWREMARQVAHEIKNPLTPMKLSLQYLQKAINNDSPNVQQLTFNVSKTLVEQIDHLSKIAADFSQFANINQVKTEVFDLHEVIQPLIVIYSKNPEVELTWQPLSQPILVFADKTQMNRVFTNLFGNGIEAARPDISFKMSVTEKIEGNNVYVTVTDNGVGISEEMLSKIFTPNFTTKSSGTGLGLAMCKTIIEQAGGEISFNTHVNVGTSFQIKMPLA
ncbi:HAMP domain-containing sensor histidine kinase [Niabella insulamsoli]|uniref:HAMP domain-containing sensor histidine kinase n=1 Tax=Niabella insulamsoli TaxID=3144874 RepID=UPI0031FD4B29